MNGKIARLVMTIVVLGAGSSLAQIANSRSVTEKSTSATLPIFITDPSSQRLVLGTAKHVRTAQLSGASFHQPTGEEMTGMESTLQTYRAGFESMDLSQVQQAWPDLGHHREATFKDVFKYLRSISATPKLGMECVPPTAVGESAWVECRETLSYTDGKGKTTQVKPAHASIELKSQGGNWAIERMK